MKPAERSIDKELNGPASAGTTLSPWLVHLYMQATAPAVSSVPSATSEGGWVRAPVERRGFVGSVLRMGSVSYRCSAGAVPMWGWWVGVAGWHAGQDESRGQFVGVVSVPAG